MTKSVLAVIPQTIPAAKKALAAMERDLDAAETYEAIRRIERQADAIKLLFFEVEEVRQQAESKPATTTSFGTAAKALLPPGTPTELIGVIEDKARDVVARDGLDGFAASRHAAIAHEVGHAIVAAHEGLAIRSISIFSRPPQIWGGWCEWEGTGWTTGPDTTAENDLSAARIVIAGLAGEAICCVDKPGSSLDELALSQLIGSNAATKLAAADLSEADYRIFAQRLWHEQVWDATVNILCDHRHAFARLAELLHLKQRIEGGQLRRIMASIPRQAL